MVPLASLCIYPSPSFTNTNTHVHTRTRTRTHTHTRARAHRLSPDVRALQPRGPGCVGPPHQHRPEHDLHPHRTTRPSVFPLVLSPCHRATGQVLPQKTCLARMYLSTPFQRPTPCTRLFRDPPCAPPSSSPSSPRATVSTTASTTVSMVPLVSVQEHSVTQWQGNTRSRVRRRAR